MTSRIVPMTKTILHIDFNSYFATVEQQANPRLRGKPIGVTGGDRIKRTVLGAASIEAKRFGVKTGMQIWEAKKLCPEIILVKGDSDKYLETTKRFLSILKGYSPYVEVFSIDEVFIQVAGNRLQVTVMARDLKSRIRTEIGEWMKVSIGISYNKLIAKLASSLKKPDGLVVIQNEQEAMKTLDRVELDEICGIGSRIKNRLYNMGIFNFHQLREVSLPTLLASFKSYGQTLYNMARGRDDSPLVPFYEKEEVKSVGHRHTIDHDTADEQEIKQLLLKLTELIARRLRAKKLMGATVHCWYRLALHQGRTLNQGATLTKAEAAHFEDEGMQVTIPYTSDGLEIFKAAWKIFRNIWYGSRIRLVGASVSNLKPLTPQNLSLLPDSQKQEIIIKTLDKINDKYGEFTLQRGTLLGSDNIRRRANPFISDRRFKL